MVVATRLCSILLLLSCPQRLMEEWTVCHSHCVPVMSFSETRLSALILCPRKRPVQTEGEGEHLLCCVTDDFKPPERQ